MNNERFSFSTGALYTYKSEDALRLIRRAGFTRAELMPQAISDVSEESTKLFEQTGIKLGSIHFPLVFFGVLYNSHPQMCEDCVAYSRKLLTMGQRLDCHVLVVHPHEKPSVQGYDELLERPVIDNLLRLADLCGEMGYTMAMENSPKTCATAEQLLDYVKFLNHPAIKPMCDVTEVKEAGGEPQEFLKSFTPCHLHMSDFGTRKHMPAGEGNFDWKAIKAALDANRYQGLYTLEPGYRFYLDDTEAKLAKAYRFLEENFGD